MTKLPLARAAALAGALLVAGCGTSKHVWYSSVHGDWRSAVPRYWNVMTDREEDHFASTNLIGPFEPEFYLGAPSFSVRWYDYRASHRLADGLVEYYDSADDFISQMLKSVYGPKYELVSDAPDRHHEAQPMHEIYVAGRRAKHFTVLSPVTVPRTTQWGTSVDTETGQLGVVRLHEYAVLPLQKGFFVIVYPATLKGFDLYKPQFNVLIKNFKVLKEGPAGPAVAAAPAQAQNRAVP